VPYVEAAGLHKSFGAVHAVDDVSFTMEKGKFLALLGPSGCGKTTTLRMIAGLSQPDAGAIRLDGRDISLLGPEKRKIGMVFQTWALFPHMSIHENIAFGLRLQKLTKAQIKQRVVEALELVQLPGLEKRLPRQLSGGQQQRVALTRALATRPKLMLFDEPLSNLDHKLRIEMRTELKNLQRTLSLTCIHVTHDQGEALSLGDHVAVMSAGKILDLREADALFNRPRVRFVADFLGATNILRGHVINEAAGDTFQAESGIRIGVAVPDRIPPESIRYAAIRPEKVALRSTKLQASESVNAFPVRIAEVDYLGTVTRYIVDLEGPTGTKLTVSDSTGRILAIGEEALATWTREDVLLLQEDPGPVVEGGAGNGSP